MSPTDAPGEEHVLVEPTGTERLESRKRELTEQRSWFQRTHTYYLLGSILAPILIPSLIWALNSVSWVALTLLPYAAICMALLPITRGRLRDLEQELQSVDFELDLLQFDVSPRETRAEKVLRINNIQLQRYYDPNLQQNFWVFGLGIFCILLGLVVIGITLYLVLTVAKDLDTKIITGVVGSIGSLLSSYIAAIYLKMHASATSHLGSFHQRLVETHQLLLRNLLASRIEDDDKRWDTLSQLSLHMSKGRGKLTSGRANQRLQAM